VSLPAELRNEAAADRAAGSDHEPALGGRLTSCALSTVKVVAVALSPSDVDAIRAAEKALAASFEAEESTAWVSSYTADAIFSGARKPTANGGSPASR